MEIIDSRGIIALNAKIFSEIVRKLPDNDVVIETESDNQAIITCEKAKFNIAAHSQEMISLIFRRLSMKILLLFPSLL